MDQPLADPSILPTYLVARLAARNHKVVLGGDGGDELWGGYPTYSADRLAYGGAPILRHFAAVLPTVFRALGRANQDGYFPTSQKILRFFERWDEDPLFRHLHWMANSPFPDALALFPDQEPQTWRAGLQACIPTAASSLLRKSPASVVDSCGRLDLATYLSEDVLSKVDRASMALGLEVRPPFLDHVFADFALSLTSKCKMDSLQLKTKSLLRRSLRGHLPAHVLGRKKHGFAFPLAQYLRRDGPLYSVVSDTLTSTELWNRLPDPRPSQTVIAGLLAAHAEGKRDHSRLIWSCYVWYRYFTTD